MNIATQNLLFKFHNCQNHCHQFKADDIATYFPDGGFEKARDKFFNVKDQDVESIYSLKYPFRGDIVFEEDKFAELVKVIPEFVISLIKVGMPQIITLSKYQTSNKKGKVLLSSSLLRDPSEIIYHATTLFDEYISEKGPRSTQKADQLYLKLNQIVARKAHYDLLGSFQAIYNSVLLMTAAAGYHKVKNINFFLHLDSKKREVLFSIGGRELQVARTLSTITGDDKISDIISRIHHDLTEHGLPGLPSSSKRLAASNSITLIPQNRSRNKAQNQIIIGESATKIEKDAAFDFLYLLAWLEKEKKPQLKSTTNISVYISNHILKGCSEIIIGSRYDTLWTRQNEADKKWEAQSQINKLLGFDLIKSSRGTFSIVPGYTIKLKPYPTK